MRIVDVSDSLHDSDWDELVRQSVNGTFLHGSHFGAQRRNAMADIRLGVEDKGRLVGGILLGDHPDFENVIVSHPRLTYGGIIHQGSLTGVRMVEGMRLLKAHLREAGFDWLHYRAIPACYHRQPSADDEYALMKMGAQVEGQFLNCVINLASSHELSSRRRRQLKKAGSLRLQTDARASADAFWDLLAKSLGDRHGVTPVHSREQLKWLINEFPGEVRIDCAWALDQLAAGVVWFRTGTCWHAQYIASSDLGRSQGGVDLILHEACREAHSLGLSSVSLGVSDEPATGELNAGLYSFKTEFGGGGQLVTHYRLDLCND